jgi:hypothetical protein
MEKRSWYRRRLTRSLKKLFQSRGGSSVPGAAGIACDCGLSETARAKVLGIETAGVKHCVRSGERERHEAGRAAEIVEKGAFGDERTRPVAGMRKTNVLSGEAMIKLNIEIQTKRIGRNELLRETMEWRLRIDVFLQSVILA